MQIEFSQYLLKSLLYFPSLTYLPLDKPFISAASDSVLFLTQSKPLRLIKKWLHLGHFQGLDPPDRSSSTQITLCHLEFHPSFTTRHLPWSALVPDT